MKERILICTIESWNSRVGANTFSTLFSDYPPEQLANLYIREEMPDSECCSRYFQISEMKAVKSVFFRNIKTGCEVQRQNADCQAVNANVQKSQKLYHSNRRKRRFLSYCARELLWLLSKWKTKELDDFLDDFKPDLVVFGMEGYIHFNRICRYILRHSGAKAIGYFWDDNFTYKRSAGICTEQMIRFFQRRSLKKLARDVDGFWAITEKTKQEADEFFGIDCQVLTKPIDFAPGETWRPYQPHSPIKMLYTGNLMIGRFDVIKKISDALDRLNEARICMELDVYTASYVPEEEQKKLGSFVHMKGSVSQEEALRIQTQADVLLFVEAYEGPKSQIARLSFSTKLTDYFHSGKCILAIGAGSIAPMEYLRGEDAAICATNEAEIYAALLKMAEDPAVISLYGQRAFLCGKRNHSRACIRAKRDAVIQKVLST